MRLISLSCDQQSFKTLYFKPTGITFILGNSAYSKESTRVDSSANGVGKTLALGLIHHCLGANVDKTLATVIPDWIFTLEFEHKDKIFKVSRSGDGKKITINGEFYKPTKFIEWLDTHDFFSINGKEIKGLTFRSLYKRFARYKREDCLDPIQLYKESDYEALLRTSFLLGLDISLILNKKQNKADLDKINHYIKNWENDPILKDMITTGTQPKLRCTWLNREISKLENDLQEFQIAENYRAIESDINSITSEIRDLERKAHSLKFQVENIDKTLEEQPDITKQDLLELYEGLQQIFRPETLEHFTAVEKFHNSLAFNRKNRLLKDRLELLNEIEHLNKIITKRSKFRDEQLKFLNGKKAIDEYTSIVNKVAAFKEERDRINEFLQVVERQQFQGQLIKESKVDQDRLAFEYVQEQPLDNFNRDFIELVNRLYPRLPAGIVLDNNSGDNQIRYNLTVQVQSDSSDGVNSARIVCFDWLLLTKGQRHQIDVLWHDNRLFADMDAIPRAQWFKFVNEQLKNSNKQYIVSLNQENYDSMFEYLTEVEKESFNNSVIIRLSGDDPKNKLLGIQFGKTVSLH